MPTVSIILFPFSLQRTVIPCLMCILRSSYGLQLKTDSFSTLCISYTIFSNKWCFRVNRPETQYSSLPLPTLLETPNLTLHHTHIFSPHTRSPVYAIIGATVLLYCVCTIVIGAMFTYSVLRSMNVAINENTVSNDQ